MRLAWTSTSNALRSAKLSGSPTLAEVSAFEDRLQGHLVNAIPGFAWSAAPDGSVGFVNQRWCDYTGMSLDEARGNGWARSVHPDDAEQLARYWGALLRSGEAGEYEAQLRAFSTRTIAGSWCGAAA